MSHHTLKVAFQGEPGSNSHTACRSVFPDGEYLPCVTFDDCFAGLEKGTADRALIAIENSIAGRVADIHQLMPDSQVSIIGEFFLPIHFHLMAPRGARLDTLKSVRSHAMAIGQCRGFITRSGLVPVVGADTAGSARHVARKGDRSLAALAPHGAAELYDLVVLKENVEDADHNTTRFLVLSRQARRPEDDWLPATSDEPVITTIVFRVRNVPAALYKALGGFATNAVNMTKLESYQIGGTFLATRFYADIEGHPESGNVALALEELDYFTDDVQILGVYPAHPFRKNFGNTREGDQGIRR